MENNSINNAQSSWKGERKKKKRDFKNAESTEGEEISKGGIRN